MVARYLVLGPRDDSGRGVLPTGMHGPDRRGKALNWFICISKVMLPAESFAFSKDWLAPGGTVSPQPKRIF